VSAVLPLTPLQSWVLLILMGIAVIAPVVARHRSLEARLADRRPMTGVRAIEERPARPGAVATRDELAARRRRREMDRGDSGITGPSTIRTTHGNGPER
jgi:hypothetical protein